MSERDDPPPPGGGGRRSLTEGAARGNIGFVSSPSVAFGATYPWRGADRNHRAPYVANRLTPSLPLVLLALRHEREAFEQHDVLFVLEQRTV